ncbi:hypothetical protein [Alkaliphilus peptidifermentans]|uniref:Uncharacterized protein n=1 Tax=Alkaliphilus peptidifermentans DSM 18978 TaxID=1120976 RepID=A0A1G5GF73_9FIRM|nr:hypothetical protein [Alkaliphilus peptidifermentans]SCY50222.1 hypothetical protein SAMN03080606_01669 [Alkaliphilus peptidifermentans DSM 18978]
MGKCKTCNSEEVIFLHEKDKVKIECINGHIYYENYFEEGGSHQRSIGSIKLEDTLFPSQLQLYNKILLEIEKNKEFYKKALPNEKLTMLMKCCGGRDKDIYMIMKKIVEFEKNNN